MPGGPDPRNALNTAQTAHMGTLLRHALHGADHIDICVAFVRFSGLNLIVDDLRRHLGRGGTVRILTSTYLGVTQPDALRALMHLRNGGALEVKLQRGSTGFHAKYYLFRAQDARTAWVGSSNLTKSGLFTSVEWNTRHSAPEAVDDCETQFAGLWTRDDCQTLDDAMIAAYEQTLLAATPPPAPAPAVASAIPTPNGAQAEALRELARLRAAGETSAAVIAATGLGKTHLAAFDVRAYGREIGRVPRTLFIAHRTDLLIQAEAVFRSVHPGVATGVLGDGRHPGDAAFVFASIQSLPGHPEVWAGGVDYVVVDEHHHAAAPSYRAVLAATPRGFLLGLTATPERLDDQDVLALCDHNVAYEVRLPAAIARGWLIPFHYFAVADDVNLRDVPWRRGSFDPAALEHALMLEARTDLILRHALEKGYDGRRRATVAFCAGVKHAQYLAAALCARGQHAAAITAATPPDERRRVYDRLSDPHDELE